MPPAHHAIAFTTAKLYSRIIDSLSHNLVESRYSLNDHNGQVAIHPRFHKLITALRTPVENGEGYLDKEATSHDDCLDAIRVSLQFLP